MKRFFTFKLHQILDNNNGNKFLIKEDQNLYNIKLLLTKNLNEKNNK